MLKKKKYYPRDFFLFLLNYLHFLLLYKERYIVYLQEWKTKKRAQQAHLLRNYSNMYTTQSKYLSWEIF